MKIYFVVFRWMIQNDVPFPGYVYLCPELTMYYRLYLWTIAKSKSCILMSVPNVIYSMVETACGTLSQKISDEIPTNDWEKVSRINFEPKISKKLITLKK